MSESPLATLMGWERRAPTGACVAWPRGEGVVELLSCLGEPVDRLRSADSQFLDYPKRRPAFEDCCAVWR